MSDGNRAGRLATTGNPDALCCARCAGVSPLLLQVQVGHTHILPGGTASRGGVKHCR
jgi:hypothetical protein